MWLNKTFIQVKLFHLWNSVFYSFLVPFVLVSTLEMVVMVVNILVTRPWWVMPRVTHPKQGSPVASPKQVVLLDEFLITVVAVEWFFTSVKPFMHSQVVLLDEFLVTVVAIEWLFSNALSGCPSGRISYHSGGS